MIGILEIIYFLIGMLLIKAEFKITMNDVFDLIVRGGLLLLAIIFWPLVLIGKAFDVENKW